MKSRSLLVLMLVSGWLGGCATAPESPSPQSAAEGAPARATFEALNKSAQAAIECVATFTRVLPDGRWEVAANLRNTSDQPLRLKIACVFYDAQDKPLKDDGARSTAEVAAGAMETVRFTAASLAAKHFTVRVSAAR